LHASNDSFFPFFFSSSSLEIYILLASTKAPTIEIPHALPPSIYFYTKKLYRTVTKKRERVFECLEDEEVLFLPFFGFCESETIGDEGDDKF
jgi:hypothetical protein